MLKTSDIRMEAQRAIKWAQLVVWRRYQRSVRAGRAMSLPNALRFFDRCCADAERALPAADHATWPARRAEGRHVLRLRLTGQVDPPRR